MTRRGWLRLMAAGVLVVWLCLFLHWDNTEKSMIRALLVETNGDSWTVEMCIRDRYGDVTTTYIKGAKDIRFGVDIKGGVNVTFVPSDGYDATDDQLEAAQLVIENRLVALNVTDYELYVDNNSDSLILEFPWQSGETEFDPCLSLIHIS